jgi:hypothetical protein
MFCGRDGEGKRDEKGNAMLRDDQVLQTPPIPKAFAMAA